MLQTSRNTLDLGDEDDTQVVPLKEDVLTSAEKTEKLMKNLPKNQKLTGGLAALENSLKAAEKQKKTIKLTLPEAVIGKMTEQDKFALKELLQIHKNVISQNSLISAAILLKEDTKRQDKQENNLLKAHVKDTLDSLQPKPVTVKKKTTVVDSPAKPTVATPQKTQKHVQTKKVGWFNKFKSFFSGKKEKEAA